METQQFPTVPSVLKTQESKQEEMLLQEEKKNDERGFTNQSPQVQMLREHCRQLGLRLFVDDDTAIRSLGITSALEGEGKSFLASTMAQALASDEFAPITLLECNWQHANLHEYFGFRATPGLAEWLRGECNGKEARRRIAKNLTVIPAGNSQADAIRLLQQLLLQHGLQKTIAQAKGILIVDLPAILTTAYGPLAATLPEALLLVTRAGVTSTSSLAKAVGQLTDLSVKGIILNQVNSKIPDWIRQLL